MQVSQQIENAEVTGTFDLTDFGSSSVFENILRAHDMEYVGQRDDPVSSYVWSNPDRSLLMTTSNNPITGQFHSPEDRHDEEGYASFILVAGEGSKALSLWETILRDATYQKGVNEPLSFPDGKRPVPEEDTRQVQV